MKLKLLPILFALTTAAYAVPESLQTGIPAFLDLDGDGQISEEERQAFVDSRKRAPRGGAAEWDTDGDGVISPEERAAAVAALRARVNERRAELFASLAGDDGVLTVEEFSSLPMLANASEQAISRLFSLLDADGDGLVTLEEFLAGVRGGAPNPQPPTTPPAPSNPQ
jgi:hypothetical protein